MKIDFIADTNFLVYVHEGNENVIPFLNYNFRISFITEVELLGYKGISKNEEVKLKQIINDCFNIEWNSKIKEQTINLRKKIQHQITRRNYCFDCDTLWSSVSNC